MNSNFPLEGMQPLLASDWALRREPARGNHVAELDEQVNVPRSGAKRPMSSRADRQHPITVQLFGGVRIIAADGNAVTVSARKGLALISYLAMSPGMAASRDKLADLFWGEIENGRPRNNLRQLLTTLRRDLTIAGADFIRSTAETISLDANVQVDVRLFRSAASSSAVGSLEQAAAAYSGPFLDGFFSGADAFESWSFTQRENLAAEAVNLLERLTQSTAGEAALSHARKLIEIDPTREASHRLKISILVQQGQLDRALKQYQTCRDLLRRELDVSPSTELEDLKKTIRTRLTHTNISGKSSSVPHQVTAHHAEAMRQPLRSKPSIAVLPFTNMSGDMEQEYFSDGISEDIITELSRFRNLFVIARNSSFIYKGQVVDVKRIGSELGVNYLLEGSVRRAGNRVRISAQLIDAESGIHIWADRFDRELADVFAVQDEITFKIVGMLTRGLEDYTLERAQRKPPESISAYEHWLRGKRLQWTYDHDNLEARRHFETAAKIDPLYSRAYSGLAVSWQMEALSFSNMRESRFSLDRAMEFAERALKLDETDYQAHIAIAWQLLYRGEYEGMKRHIDRAIMLNPNDADKLADSSYMLAMYGDGDAAVACAEKAALLNPRHPGWYTPFHTTALFVSRRYREAFELISRLPDYFIDSTFFRAAMLAQLGRLDEARQTAERATARLSQRLGGTDKMDRSCVQFILENNPFRKAQDQQHLADALRKAGVPG